MGLRRIERSGWRWLFTAGRAEPKVPRALALGKVLVKIANAGDRGVRAWSGLTPEQKTLQERGLVRISRREPGERQNGNRSQRATLIYITDLGWEAVWSENLGGDRPLPKSARVERSSHQARRA